MFFIKNENIEKFFIFFLILGFFVISAYLADSVLAQASSDAVAIRVIPNSGEHWSALRWYTEKNFTGAPQSLLVDGYEAVRDGRTVYVNAANVSDPGSGDELYTNIYIISFNQNAESQTADIFGQILAHWKFNSNISEIGQCSLSTTRNCLVASECPATEFCLSLKARIVRDTRRLADLADIKSALGKFKSNRGSYPSLSAGTYLPHYSLSVWPSWQKVMSYELGFGGALPVDPMNKLGPCPAEYNPITCWNENDKRFYDPIANAILDVPALSNVYVYNSDSSGSAYNLCAIMESGLVSGADSGNCGVMGNIGDAIPNLPPEFVSSNLSGYANEPFAGYVYATDPNGDSLTWTIALNAADYSGSGWSAAPALAGVNRYQQVLRSDTAGTAGNYSLALTIDDGRGGLVFQNFSIAITARPPGALAPPNMTYTASSVSPLNYRFTVSDQAANPLTYGLTGQVPAGWTAGFTPNAGNYIFSLTGILNNSEAIAAPRSFGYNLSVTNSSSQTRSGVFAITVINNPPLIVARDVRVVVGRNDLVTNPLVITASDPDNNRYTYSFDLNTLPAGLTGSIVGNTYVITGVPNGAAPVSLDYDLTISATDEYQATSSRQFRMTLVNSRPIVSLAGCSRNARLNAVYTCQAVATDPDNHAIVSYRLIAGSYPPGLTIDQSGLISGSPRAGGSYNLAVTATDQYGAVSDPAVVNLTFRSFCGDLIRQTPNMEGQGGPANDGREDCDGVDNVASAPNNSSASRQYACTGACVYTGGWCGDGSWQNAYGEQCDGTSNTAATPLQSSAAMQYSCSADCQFAGGYCGDGSWQNAYGEQCDGSDNIAVSPLQSSAAMHYGCSAGCQFAGGYCGDGILQSAYGEECDTNLVTTCCNRCQFTCPPYLNRQLGFAAGQSIALGSGESTTFTFPVCRIFDPASAFIDLNYLVSLQYSAIVFVTDYSNSMDERLCLRLCPIKIDAAKAALTLSINALHDATAGMANVFNVGLVRFSSVAQTVSSPIVDVVSDVNTQNLITTLNNWTTTDGTRTDVALALGRSMLNTFNPSNVTRKIIILLSDGEPTCPLVDVVSQVDDARTEDIEIYTVAYTVPSATGLITRMCEWSNYEPSTGLLCNSNIVNGPYAYSNANVDTAYSRIIEDILRIPTSDVVININGVTTSITPDIFASTHLPLNVSGITCNPSNQTLPFSVNYTGLGRIQFSNLVIGICDICIP